jgi:2-succinyl-5-enolpyruvyl-6-hydroxy-3-cyclohexene-1-carboxylate synthase
MKPSDAALARPAALQHEAGVLMFEGDNVAEKSGADILIDSLLAQGVDTVFGYPGGAVLPIYDALFQHPKIRHVLVRHEAGAAHAAEGYARSTGKPGVVLVTSGPGATNAVTGIADAFLDSIPLVVLTGQVATNLIGSDAFQEADTVGITRHCTKHNYLVKDPSELAKTVAEAFHIATQGITAMIATSPLVMRILLPSHKRLSFLPKPKPRSSTRAAESSIPAPMPAQPCVNCRHCAVLRSPPH